MNRILKSSLILLASLPLSTLANPQYNKGGFYAGLDVGGTQYLSQFSDDAQGFASGYDVNIKLGYALFTKVFYLGAEAAANWNTASDSLSSMTLESETLSSNTQVSVDAFEPTFDLKPGFKIGRNALLYARVGGTYNQVKLTEDAFTALQDFNLSKTKDVVALRLGAGVEVKFSRKWALCFDYIHTDYGNLEVQEEVDGVIVSQSTDLMRNTVTLGMNYYF